jgi:hypothetical protein
MQELFRTPLSPTGVRTMSPAQKPTLDGSNSLLQVIEHFTRPGDHAVEPLQITSIRKPSGSRKLMVIAIPRELDACREQRRSPGRPGA